jgi:hypothetical protein
VKVCWLAKATFFPIASVFRSLLLCSCLSLLGFFFFFFLLSLILFVSLCSYSSSVFFFLPVFFLFLSLCRPGFSVFVFGWLDQQPAVRGS